MPGEQGFISALDASVVNLALAAVVVALIVVVLMALLYVVTIRQSSGNLREALENSNKLLGALVTQGNQLVTQGQQINRHGEQLESMLRVMEHGQTDLSAVAGQTLAIKTSLDVHEGSSETRSQALIKRIDTMAGDITNLIGDTGQKVAEGTTRVIDTLRLLLDKMTEVKGSVEDAKAQARAQQEELATKQQAALDAIESKLGIVSEQVIDVIQAIGEMSDEEQISVDGAGAGPVPVSAGSDASGSANGTGIEHTGDTSGTADG